MLQEAFPYIQFIVSTHSPFIAQAASEGGLFVLRSGPGDDAVRVVQPVPSVKGWRTDAILTSELFNLKDTVDPETEEMLREYHELSTKRSFGQLSDEEQARLDTLEVHVSNDLTAPGETIEERRRRQETDAYIGRALKELNLPGMGLFPSGQG